MDHSIQFKFLIFYLFIHSFIPPFNKMLDAKGIIGAKHEQEKKNGYRPTPYYTSNRFGLYTKHRDYAVKNLEQFLSNKRQGVEYMGSRKTVDSRILIWALFSDFENPREFASRTVDLTENKLFRECSMCEMFSFFFFR